MCCETRCACHRFESPRAWENDLLLNVINLTYVYLCIYVYISVHMYTHEYNIYYCTVYWYQLSSSS